MSRGRKNTAPERYNPDVATYRWSKMSSGLLFFLISIFCYCGFMLYVGGSQMLFVLIAFFSLAIYGFFYNITVIVDGHGMIVSYGIGLVYTEIDTSAIDKTQIMKNTGLTPVIYNPLGENSLLISLRGGGMYRVPCDDVKKLQQCLSRRY